MNGAALLQIIGSAAFAAVLVAIINAFVTRRKLGAEATKIITDAATSVVTRLEEDNRRLRESDTSKARRITELERRVDDLEAEREDQRRVLQLHAAWDHMAISKLRECQPPLSLPEPTPLTPPYRRKPRKDGAPST